MGITEHIDFDIHLCIVIHQVLLHQTLMFVDGAQPLPPELLVCRGSFSSPSRTTHGNHTTQPSVIDVFPELIPVPPVPPGPPPLPINVVITGGWHYPTKELEDILLEIEDIDAELAELACDYDKEHPEEYDPECRVIIPDILPPGWRSSGQQDKKSPFNVRHVHYNFASDIDFGVRRKIVGLLDLAERRSLDIFGSEAFRTYEDVKVQDLVVRKGTDAWVVKLSNKSRLELARMATVVGFKLISFDATSLSLIHRKTFPWKPVMLSAGMGLMAGYLIWGRKPIK